MAHFFLDTRKDVRHEINKMLDAESITPASSEWSLPVGIATIEDGAVRFCVDHHALNQSMKADGWPIPKIDEIFDELKDGRVFTTLDSFSG